MDYKRFDELLKKRGYSGMSFAKMIGVSDSQARNWRQGKTDPSSENLKAIALALGVSADYLLGIADSPDIQSELPVPDLNIESRMLKNFRQLDSDDQLFIAGETVRLRKEAQYRGEDEESNDAHKQA